MACSNVHAPVERGCLRRTGLLVILGALMAACSGESELTEAGDRFLSSFAERDYLAYEKAVGKHVARVFHRRRFFELADGLHRLGALKVRRCEEAGARAGGGYHGRFMLRFDEGIVQFTLTLRDGKIRAFSLKGETLRRALRSGRKGIFFHDARTEDDAGKVRKRFAPNERVTLSARLQGIRRDKDGKVNVTMTTQVFRGRAAMMTNSRFAAKQAKVPKGLVRLRGLLRLGAGRYRVFLSVFDRISKSHARGMVRFDVVAGTKAGSGTKAGLGRRPTRKGSAH
ncbi:MAG: hypothetical protein KAI47_01840 [Deltaproteobacteria bacterium]|nr:hypothetical protein [Deltaproteobacteria bacterium]